MFRRRMKDELKIQEMKLQMKSKGYKKRDKIVNKERIKLSKLVKTKFDGTSWDWFLFWKDFESEIEKAEIGHLVSSPILKSFYSGERDYLMTVSLLHLRVIQEANLYYLVHLVSHLKLLRHIFSVLPRCLSSKVHIQTKYKILKKN